MQVRYKFEGRVGVGCSLLLLGKSDPGCLFFTFAVMGSELHIGSAMTCTEARRGGRVLELHLLIAKSPPSKKQRLVVPFVAAMALKPTDFLLLGHLLAANALQIVLVCTHC